MSDPEVVQDVITRSEWGARPPKNRRAMTPKTSPTLHWNGPSTKLDEFSTPEAEIRYLKGVQRFHMDSKGWSDFAYNFAFAPSGRVYEGRGWGIRSAGNGTKRGNDTSYAFLLMVGEGDEITQQMIDAVRRIRALGSSKYVKGHRDWKSTACPGHEIYNLIREDKFEGLPDDSKRVDPDQPNDVPATVERVEVKVRPDLSALRLKVTALEDNQKATQRLIDEVKAAINDVANF